MTKILDSVKSNLLQHWTTYYTSLSIV